MKYTVTLKILYPDGYVEWTARMAIDDVDTAEEASEKAKTVIMKSVAFKDCQVVDTRVSEYKQGDEKRLTYDAQRWELEEEKENAPANIARALNRIASNIRDLKQSPAPVVREKEIDPFALTALIFSSISVITSVILILIFRQ